MPILALVLHVFIGSTVAGALVIAVLTMGYDTLTVIAGAGIIGFVAAIPVSWMVARAMRGD